MSAREMFEELNFSYNYIPERFDKEYSYEPQIKIEGLYKGCSIDIIFYVDSMEYELFGVFDIKLNKAIQQQILELGWEE